VRQSHPLTQNRMPVGEEDQIPPMPADTSNPLLLTDSARPASPRGKRRSGQAGLHLAAFERNSCALNRLGTTEANPYQRPGRRVVTSWTNQALPSGSAKAKNDP
jgi:hypothetical protein